MRSLSALEKNKKEWDKDVRLTRMLYPTCPLWGLDEDQLSDSKLYKIRLKRLTFYKLDMWQSVLMYPSRFLHFKDLKHIP